MGSRPTKYPAIPDDTEGAVPALKEAMEVALRRRGDPLDGFVRFRDLQDSKVLQVDFAGSGVVSVRPGSGFPSGAISGPGEGAPDFGQDNLARPPRPTGVRARGLNLSTIGVVWDPPPYSNHAYAEIFAAFEGVTWDDIKATFSPSKPIGPGNQSAYFMGRAGGTSFMHRNLGSTVPVAQLSIDVLNFAVAGESWSVSVEGNREDFVSAGEEVYLVSDEPWEGNGLQGEVLSANWISGDDITVITVAGAVQFSPDAPGDISIIAIRSEDDLEQALNPRPVYYWVRFVSTAQIPGPVQGQVGAQGTVMVNPTEVLNVLTGRIRSSQLANDIVAPINFIRGPISERNPDGTRKYPTVRDFVLAQGTEILSEYDEVLFNVMVGNIAPEDSPFEGAAAAAVLVQEVSAAAEDNQTYIQFLQTLEAAFEDGDAEGIDAIVSTITQRALVQASDEGALAYIADTLQVEVGDNQYSLNQIAQNVETHGDAINNTITLRVQQVNSGVYTSAGFGIGLSGDGDDLTSTFAVAVDQFAVMSSANEGRRVLSVQHGNSTTHHINTDNAQGTPFPGEHFAIGDRVTLTVPFGGEPWKQALRGKVFRVSSISGRQVRLQQADGEEFTPLPWELIDVSGEAVVLFKEQSVPFVINTTAEGGPVVGIRGRLVVDGMISAREVEVTELLRANEIWAVGITAFGLIQTPSLIGETIATPRFCGWSVKMTSPDTSFSNRVLEFSQWGHVSDQTPDPSNEADAEDIVNQAEKFVQLTPSQPNDTSFFLDAQGNVFVRGALQVGGNARIMTHNPTFGPGEFMVQMDTEFPFAVFPRNQIVRGSQQTSPWQQWNYAGDSGLAPHVRNHALMWVQRNGMAGFNTATESIFMGDTPMEPPAGGGSIRVITRLADGQFTGRGRVYISVSFEIRSNRFEPSDRIGVWYDLFLVPADMDLGGMPQTIAMTQRQGQIATPDGATHPFQLGGSADYMDSHFLIIRAPYNNGDLAPGWFFRQQWIDEKGIADRHVRGLYSATPPPREAFIDGDIEVASGGNYRAVVVATEVASRTGVGLFGAVVNTRDDGSGAAVMLLNGRCSSQQISTRRLVTPVAKNSWSTGSGGGTTPPDPGGPGDPGDPGQPPIITLGQEPQTLAPMTIPEITVVVDGGEDLE